MDLRAVRTDILTGIFGEEMLFRMATKKLGMKYFGGTRVSPDDFFKLKISIGKMERGVIFTSDIFRPNCGKKSDNPLINKAACEGRIVVTWSEIGLAGLRSLKNLFEEFADGNEKIKRLMQSSPSPFDPNFSLPLDLLYLPEDKQPLLFRLWEEQLNIYKESISHF